MNIEPFLPRHDGAFELEQPARAGEVADLLKGAVDLHCHSGPAAMPRILDHREAMREAAEAGFRALLFKDHYYVGMPHAILLQSLYPEDRIELFSGIALNNATGGINPHAVDHAVALGAAIVWMPTLSAANHLADAGKQTKTFPKTTRRMLPVEPLSVLDANGALTDKTKQVLDIIAEADIILSGGHLSAGELHVLFEEAGARGVKKMLVNHPTYVIGCTDEDIRQLVGLGAHMEHSIGMFVGGKSLKFTPQDLAHLIEVAGIDRTILSSDLGLIGSPRPVTGFRAVVQTLLDLDFPAAEIRKLIGGNAASLLDLQHIGEGAFR
ncbi:amidohydrolase family protein [Rhizobium sp. CFBP 8752]|jgi:hypothetical protein|uniref:DUF6282 family protein n=1 Tax=Rhizobium sp. CFBP 8752 TaxID=2775301 RepID=UPI0017808F32|nr:DUF6282 family protein [Rhizobium sp. CFBP 8752]MBD8664720.1 amidohydrolase family protein [Rhizobium sp. CFBP 8752]